jgi:hypothetical protein
MRCRTRGATRRIGFASRPQICGAIGGVGERSWREPKRILRAAALKAIGRNPDA